VFASRALSGARRLKRVFGIDVETCAQCGGQLRIIACIEDRALIDAILAHLDQQSLVLGPGRISTPSRCARQRAPQLATPPPIPHSTARTHRT